MLGKPIEFTVRPIPIVRLAFLKECSLQRAEAQSLHVFLLPLALRTRPTRMLCPAIKN